MSDFPRTARYPMVIENVYKFFETECVSAFPIDPFAIIDRNCWGVITYSELAEVHGVRIADIIDSFQSEDGYTIRDAHGYTIAYNDNIGSLARIRFTLMHEIGHIYLGHLVDFQETILTRSKLTESKYRVLENEANCFARNALAPAHIAQELGLESEYDLMHYFHISYQAAKTRLQLMWHDSIAPLNFWGERAGGFLNRILHVRYCRHCNTLAKGNSSYCVVCGKNEFINRRGGIVLKYDGYELDGNGMPAECPRCENEEITGEHCKVCGILVVNRCTHVQYDFSGNVEWECGTIADGNARYCSECGNKTTYLENGLLKPWEEAKRELEEEEDRTYSLTP